MDKVSEFFLKQLRDDGNFNEFPVLTKEEEKEVLDHLGIESLAENETISTSERILASLKKVREFSLATGEAAAEIEDNENYIDYGTVVIKTKSGQSTTGTLRVKKGDDRFGSIIFRDTQVSTDDLPNAFDTMRVIETAASDRASPDWSQAGKQPESPSEGNFLWRAPEEWEVNIIALERGEWAENMPESAFRKYKKERPKLGNLFTGSSSSPAITTQVESVFDQRLSRSADNTPAESSSSTHHISHHRSNFNSNSSGTDHTTSPSENEKKKKHKQNKSKDKGKEKEKEKDKERPGPGKERRWAVFRRSAAERQKLADA